MQQYDLISLLENISNAYYTNFLAELNNESIIKIKKK